MRKKIIVRADGNTVIGFGHVFRLLALADILRSEFEIVFITDFFEDWLGRTVEQYVDSLIELKKHYTYTVPALRDKNAEMPFDFSEYVTGEEIIVIDGYWFGTECQKAIKKTGAVLVCIDDFAENYFYADAVVNHAPGVDKSMYRGEAYTGYYLGLDYALLRSAFFKQFSYSPEPGSVLVSMGGTDSYGITGRVLDALVLTGDFKFIHILASSSYSQALIPQIEKYEQRTKIQLHIGLAASELVALMDLCSVAVVSASTVLLEAYSRRMNCITGYYTDNQKYIYNGFIAENRAVGLGDLNYFAIPHAAQQLHAAVQAASKTNKLQMPLGADKNLRMLFSDLCQRK